jgi:hypothetical protein
MGGLEEIKNEAVDLVRNYCLLPAVRSFVACALIQTAVFLVVVRSCALTLLEVRMIHVTAVSFACPFDFPLCPSPHAADPGGKKTSK